MESTIGTHGWGARPCTEDAEVVEDLLIDILSKSTMDPSSDPELRGGKGSGGPPATNTGAATGATGFTTGWLIGIGALAMLACTGRATTCIAGRAGASRAVMGGEGKEYGGGWTSNRMGIIREVEESSTVEDIGYGSYYDLTLESEAKASTSCTGLRNVSSFL